MAGSRRLLLLALAFALGVIAFTQTSPQPSPGPASPPAPSAPSVPSVQGSLPGDQAAPTTVSAHVGQLVVLTVSAPQPDSVTIAGLDLYHAADPSTPAKFSLVPARSGRFPVRLVSNGRVLGVLVVHRPAP